VSAEVALVEGNAHAARRHARQSSDEPHIGSGCEGEFAFALKVDLDGEITEDRGQVEVQVATVHHRPAPRLRNDGGAACFDFINDI